MEFFVDRELPVSLRTQLQGLIEYGIVCGELAPGEMLPSIRDLAEKVGVAPMTVNQVYAELKAAGFIEARPRAGTFVASHPNARLATRPDTSALHRQIDQLIDDAHALGVRSTEFVSLVSARTFYRESIGQRPRIAMVGLFSDATASHARFIAERLGQAVTVEPLTIAAIQHDAGAKARASSADVVVTFANRQREVVALVPAAKVVTIRFTPSEETRMALASLDSLVSILAVARFPDFLPIMKAGVQRFAPHVGKVVGATLETPHLDGMIAQATVVVHGSGAQAIVERLPGGMQAFEYRHAPDVVDIERVLVPIIDAAIASAAMSSDVPQRHRARCRQFGSNDRRERDVASIRARRDAGPQASHPGGAEI